MTNSLYDEARQVCAGSWDFDRCRNCPIRDDFDGTCTLFGPPGCWPDEKELADMIGYKKPTLWERFLNFIGVEIED